MLDKIGFGIDLQIVAVLKASICVMPIPGDQSRKPTDVVEGITGNIEVIP